MLLKKNSLIPFKKIFRITLGILFLFLGIIGLFLPVFQGILFLIIGIILLAPYNRSIRNQLANIEFKHPELYLKAQALKKKLKSLFLRR